MRRAEVLSAPGTLSRGYQLVCHRRTFHRYQLPLRCASQRIRLRLRLSVRRPVFSFLVAFLEIWRTLPFLLRPYPLVRISISLKRVLLLTPYLDLLSISSDIPNLKL